MKILIWFLTLGFAGALAAEDLKSNRFFQAAAGKWKGTGEMTNAAGEIIKARNTLDSSLSEDGAQFTMKGHLVIGEDGTAGEAMPIDYRWEFVRSALEGLYAAQFIMESGDGSRNDYEVSIDESSLTARLNQISGASGDTRNEVVQKIVDGKFVVNFKLIDSNGQNTLTGELTFEKES